MKKFLSFILIFTVVLGTVAFADSAEMEKVLGAVKQRIQDTEMFDRMDSRQTVSGDGRTTYRFTWMSEADPEAGELSVTVTDGGVVTNYYRFAKSDFADEKLSVNRKTHGEIQPVAEAFLKKINPDIAHSLKITPASGYESLRATYYDFEIQRMEKGLPVYGDIGHITVTPDGKTVESFSLRYAEGLSFENVEKIIDVNSAKAAYGEKLGLKLYYTLRYDNGKREVVAVYSPKGAYNEYISAVSGQVVTPLQPDYSGENYKFMTEESVTMDSAANGAFTEAEKAELKAVEGLITKEEAAEKVLSSKVLPLFARDYKAERFNLSKDYYDTKQYYWNISFEGEDGYADAQVDAVTGRITSFYKNRKYTEEEKIAPEQARKIANTTLSVLAPEFFPADGKSPYVPDDYNGGYTFNWTRYENGIPFDSDNAYVTVDSVNGDVVGFHLMHKNLEFPSLEGIISEEAALVKMFEHTKYEPFFIKTCSEKGAKAYDKAIAVYMLNDSNPVLKAENGELLYGNGTAGEITPYTDISGHFSENAVVLLQKYGIGFSGGKFLPDEVITQRDLLALLNNVFYRGGAVVLGSGFDYNEVYRTAQRNKIITKAEHLPDGPVNRETAAVMLVRAMGLEEAAALDGIFVSPFPDVTEKVGYVAILGAMGVLKGDGSGNFNPKDSITRGEAAVMIVNYLSR